jgi:hypothetical protein
MLGSSTWDDFRDLTGRLQIAVRDSKPLTDLDWARTLFLTEITWASQLVGSGLDFASVTRFPDTKAVGLLRALQRKISNRKRAELLFRLGDPIAATDEEQEAFLERLRREQEGRQYPPGL